MRSRVRYVVAVVAVLALVAVPLPGLADHGTRPIEGALEALGDDVFIRPSSLGQDGEVSSDIGFWGDRAYQGNWHGFRIIDISDPNAPSSVLDYLDCGPFNPDLGQAGETGQGDIVVWDRDDDGVADLLVWADNSGAGAGLTCDGDPIPEGFEGIQIFDISNELDPDRIGSVETVDGTHTLTAVPDEANDRMLIYSNPSSGNGFQVIEIPRDDPAAATLLRTEAARGSCHDISVFLGDVLRTICAGGSGTTVYSNDPADGGSLINPKELYDFPQDGVSLAHSAAFTWDGKRFVIGHEPGGGTQARCSDNARELERTLFMYRTSTGKLLGKWVIENLQEPVENCTTHNFNFIPTTTGKDILVSGHYQAGTWVVDWTDPANPETIGSADPPPLDPNQLVTAGAWSSYWYNGHIYETDITKGLHIFGLNTPEGTAGGFRPEEFSNPQTQLESIEGPRPRLSLTKKKISKNRFRLNGEIASAPSICDDASGQLILLYQARSEAGQGRVVDQWITNSAGGYKFEVGRAKNHKWYHTEFHGRPDCEAASSPSRRVPRR